jgi:hypothetical protein
VPVHRRVDRRPQRGELVGQHAGHAGQVAQLLRILDAGGARSAEAVDRAVVLGLAGVGVAADVAPDAADELAERHLEDGVDAVSACVARKQVLGGR